MASIIEVGELQFKVQIRKKGHPPQYATFQTAKEAKNWADDIESDMRRGIHVSRAKAERITLSELIQRYRQEVLPQKRGKHLSPALKKLDAALGMYTLTNLSTEIIKKYRDDRLKNGGVSGETTRKEINILSLLIKFAGEECGWPVPENPCKNVKRPSPGKARGRRLRDGELEALLAAAPANLGLLTRFAIASGARLGELLALNWSDIDEKTNLITIRGILRRELKNEDESREMLLFPETKTILGEVKALLLKSGLPDHSDARIFPWWRAADSLNKSWTRAKTQAQAERLKQSGKEVPKRSEPVVKSNITKRSAGIEGVGDATTRDGKKSIKQVNQAGKRVAAQRVAIDGLSDGFLSDLRFHDLRREAGSRWLEEGKTPLEVSEMLGHKSPSITLGVYASLSMKEMAKKYC